MKNKSNTVIYTVTTIENLMEYPLLFTRHDSKSKKFTIKEIQDWRDNIQHTRTVAFYYDLDDAIACIENNVCDIYEGSYKHAVIEATGQGVYPIPPDTKGKSEIWFEWQGDWDTGGYKRIGKPESTKTTICWGIG